MNAIQHRQQQTATLKYVLVEVKGESWKINQIEKYFVIWNQDKISRFSTSEYGKAVRVKNRCKWLHLSYSRASVLSVILVYRIVILLKFNAKNENNG